VETVAVCDTEPIAIEGLKSLLISVEGLRVVATGTSLSQGMDSVRELKPSLLLLGKSFGFQEVMNSLQELKRSELPTHPIIWSSAVSDVEALRLLHAGAAGVIRKTASLKTLLTCLRAVASGKTWMEDDMPGDAGRPVRPTHSALTAREQQVMERVERGLKNRDIGAELGICTGTVKIHLKHIFEKTGIRGRYGLALSGLKEKGLLTLPAVTDRVEAG
jgi:DNA-binding NarL/FixJ family response regulator